MCRRARVRAAAAACALRPAGGSAAGCGRPRVQPAATLRTYRRSANVASVHAPNGAAAAARARSCETLLTTSLARRLGGSRVQSARSSPPPPSVAFSSGTCPSFWCSNCYTAANYKTGAALESSEAAALTGVSPYGGRRHLRQAELVPNVGCQAAVGVTATNTWSPFIGGTDAVTCQQSCSVYVVSGQVITLDATTGNGNQAVGIQVCVCVSQAVAC